MFFSLERSGFAILKQLMRLCTNFLSASILCRWTMMSTTSRVLRVCQESLRLITTTDHTPSWLWLHLAVARSAINLFLLLHCKSHVITRVCIPSSLKLELIDSKNSNNDSKSVSGYNLRRLKHFFTCWSAIFGKCKDL